MTDNRCSISFESEEEMERFLLILNLGILTGLRRRAITFEEAKLYLYKPWDTEDSEENQEDHNIASVDEEMLKELERYNTSVKSIKIDKIMKETISLLKSNYSYYDN